MIIAFFPVETPETSARTNLGVKVKVTLLKHLPLLLKISVLSQQHTLFYVNRPLLKGLTVQERLH